MPDELRSAWTLHRGTTVRILPRVVRHIPPIGLFIHDSLFTSRNTMRELELAYDGLDPCGAVLVNCVHRSPAFAPWVEKRSPAFSLTVSAEQKQDQIGTALFGEPPPAVKDCILHDFDRSRSPGAGSAMFLDVKRRLV